MDHDYPKRGTAVGTDWHTVYANRILDGKAATNNMIRIVCRDRSTSGFLFAFFSTDIGLRLILRESYGSTLPHIYEPWLGEISIPWPDDDVRQNFGRRVIEAFDRRAETCEIEDRAQAILAEAVGINGFSEFKT